MQLPPYDTTAPLHRQQEPPRTATHSKTQKQDMQKTKKEFLLLPQSIFLFHIYYARGASPAWRGQPRKPSFIYYIYPRGFTPCGVFFCLLDTKAVNAGPAGYQGRQCRPWFPHTKNAARKNAAKSKHKKHCKKIFIFLIILHIKYEDKKTSRRQNIKK